MGRVGVKCSISDKVDNGGTMPLDPSLENIPSNGNN